MKAYCVKCKTERELCDIEPITIKNRKENWAEAIKGRCSTCGTEVIRIVEKCS